jgi:predicted DNA-binding ribbon-helix-helix protein
MNQRTPKTTNNQTVRLPMDLYERIAELAMREDTTMNTMIIRLLHMGLGHQANFEKAVRDFVFRIVSKEEMDKLTYGNIDTTVRT